MRIRVFPRTHKSAVAVAGLMVAAVGLSGCSSLGSRTFGDQTVTGSTAQTAPATLGQPMPASLGAPPQQMAAMQFLPPAPVGANTWSGANTMPPAPVGGGFMQPVNSSPIGMGASPTTVQTQALPALNSPSPLGNTQAMPAQQTLAPLPTAPAAVAMGTPASSSALPVNSSVPVPAAAANTNGYQHTIAAGESLYTIARKYDVTTQALVHANSLSSPDKIVVGQRIVIPGRSDLNSAPAPVQVASAAPGQALGTMPDARPAGLPNTANVVQTAATPTPAPVAATPTQPQVTQVASVPTTPVPAAAEPAMSGSDKFRWPVSGRVITDFAASRGTGINIDVPEGSSVKAAENGTVIYVGSGVEGYGNLVLIRHPNGYVSAYAHLQNMSVAKGATVNRGDSIGTVGMTGSVSRPQLHFELRKGATPVDPVPLLAS
jgi:murein DD-endopeptidase MepM/ murein hydrolase activator NlpD